MNLPLFIAGRYLFAGKSHNVINVISAISAAGMAIGTAAIILILSVYNGFNGIIEDNLSRLDPDVLVVPASGKCFHPSEAAALCALEEVASVGGRVSENVFLTYGEKQSVALARGVDSVYEARSGVSLHRGDLALCSVGSGLASTMCINPVFVEPVVIWYPDRTAEINPMNAASSLRQEKVIAADIFNGGSADGELLIVPIETMRSLMLYTDEVSALEIRLEDGSDKSVRGFISKASGLLPDNLELQDRYRQNPGLYRMMRYEKLAIFLILIFVIIIIGFNVLSSLTMLMIEKEQDISTLSSLGASRSTVRRVFVLEGWLITLTGLAAGLVIGVGLSLLQQHFGLVKMPGNYLLSSYPVIIQWTDVLVTAVSVAAVGWVIAALTAGRRINAA